VTFVSQSDTGKRIWWPGFDRLTTLRGWKTDAERARQLGISHATLTNLRADKVLAGVKVVDRVLKVFGDDYYRLLFDDATADETEAA
jgi:hypothetical protein